MFKVTILGCGAPSPLLNRAPTAQLIETESSFILVDCAEGTQLQLQKFKKSLNKIDYILISHCHGDHYYGIFGLLQTMNSSGNRVKPLVIYCPIWLKQMLESPYSPVKLTNLSFPISIRILGKDEINLIPVLDVKTIPVRHRGGECYAFKFTELRKPRNIDKEKIEKFNLSVELIKQIKCNENKTITIDGKEYNNDDFLLPEKHRGCYIYSADTLPDVERLGKLSSNDCDILYHDSTYDKSMAIEATRCGHSTSAGAANVAKNLGVTKLIIGHFSTRYKSDEDIEKILQGAKEIFPNTEAAFDGMTFEVK